MWLLTFKQEVKLLISVLYKQQPCNYQANAACFQRQLSVNQSHALVQDREREKEVQVLKAEKASLVWHL